jgi:hypothetical protein
VLIVTSLNDADLKLADALGYGACKTGHIAARWLAVCAPAGR